jgi:hypothetical protein
MCVTTLHICCVAVRRGLLRQHLQQQQHLVLFIDRSQKLSLPPLCVHLYVLIQLLYLLIAPSIRTHAYAYLYLFMYMRFVCVIYIAICVGLSLLEHIYTIALFISFYVFLLHVFSERHVR